MRLTRLAGFAGCWLACGVALAQGVASSAPPSAKEASNELET
jgi:hypothetical protein